MLSGSARLNNAFYLHYQLKINIFAPEYEIYSTHSIPKIMNKTDLMNEIAAKADLTKAQAKAAMDACLESIAQALANEDRVSLLNFGTFMVVEKEARTGINPRTKEKIEIPARKVVKFKPSPELGK